MAQLSNPIDHAVSVIDDLGMKEILCKLKELLAERHQGFQAVRKLILRLATRLETNRKC